MSDGAPEGPDGCMHASRGLSMTELFVVLLSLGFLLTAGVAAWRNIARKGEVLMAARLVQGSLMQARMFAAYRAVNHFLVIDPTKKSVEIYEDNGTTKGKFDNGDKRVSGESWPFSVSLAMPPSSSSLPNPLGGGTNLTSAWSLPLPDSTARWGSTLRGLMATPTGRIQSAESTPQTVSSGGMIFSDDSGQIASVGVRGQFGNVLSYQMVNSAWRDIR